MPPQFLVIGHAVRDLLTAEAPGPWRLGGTAAYASMAAQRLGLRTALLTAVGGEMPLQELLPGVDCAVVDSPHTTLIRNVYEGGRRHQYIPQRAARIGPEQLPDDWRQTAIVLLGPVAAEVDGGLAACFPGSLLGVGAQGWLRRIERDGRVRPLPPGEWEAGPLLGPARALFVSDEDVAPDEAPAALEGWSAQVEIVAFTRGDRGAEVCVRGEWRHIDPFPARTLDPTGAGDVFAAAFLVRLHESGDPWAAARFAACAASFVVEGEGTAAVPNRQQVEARLRQHPEIVCR